ncbi:MAG TPA: HD domain-containing phosphohydrolase [Candidatus Sulfotelmatobacter sp.]|nr:HD domain-containing phosphohydrolase [Candidatus Sulfotelmatobacter sp.]
MLSQEPQTYRFKQIGLTVPAPMRPPRILLLEDQPEIRTLIAAMLKSRGLDCDAAGSLEEARRLAGRHPYDVYLLDVSLPDGCGLTLAEQASNAPLVIVITGSNDIQTAVDAIRNGAIDFITKPFSVGDFLQRIDKAMEEWSSRMRMRHYALALENLVAVKTRELSSTSRQMEEIRDASVAALGAALNLKDHETSEHCARVSGNSVRLGAALSLSSFELRNLKWGAHLHDVGKIGIPESILLKPAALTLEERAVVERHPLMGWSILRGIEFLRNATDVVLSHHERFDGSGYPSRLLGATIPLNARIFAVMDALDAMTSERPYRPAMPFAAACGELERQAGKQFDPDIVDKFLRASGTTWSIQGASDSQTGQELLVVKGGPSHGSVEG